MKYCRLNSGICNHGEVKLASPHFLTDGTFKKINKEGFVEETVNIQDFSGCQEFKNIYSLEDCKRGMDTS